MIFPAECTHKFFLLSDVESRGAIKSTTTCIRVQNGGTRSNPSRGNLSHKAVNSTGAVNICRHRRAQTLKQPKSSITAITLPVTLSTEFLQFNYLVNSRRDRDCTTFLLGMMQSSQGVTSRACRCFKKVLLLCSSSSVPFCVRLAWLISVTSSE